MNTNFIKIVFILTLIFVVNTKASIDIDSLKQIISLKKENDIDKIKLLLQLSDALIDNGSKQSVVYSDMALKMADSLNNEYYKAKSHEISGIGWLNWGNNAKALESLFASYNIYHKLNKPRNYAEILRNIGESYRAVGQFDKALQYLHLSDSIFSKSKDSSGLARTYNRIAAVYYEMCYNNEIYRENYKKLFDMEISYFELYNKENIIKSSYDSAIKYIKLSNYIAERRQMYKVKINTDITLAALYNVSFQLKESEILYDKILKYTYSNNLTTELPFVLNNVAGFYHNNHQFDIALKYSLEAFELAKKYDFKAYYYMISAMISSIYERLGDFKSANEYTQIHYEARMDYFRNDIEATLIAAHYENELVAKNKEIEFTKKFNYTIIFTSGLILLITFIFVLVNYKKNKEVRKLNESLVYKNQVITEQKEKLELMNIEKDKFFSIIAHDLKNPLGTFKNITNMMQESSESFTESERADLIKLMEESAGNVYTLLENLLEWSMSQRGKIIFSPVEIELSYFTELIINIINPLAQAKNIEITNNIPKSIFVKADENMLNTVLRNLLSNAVKFTPKGGKIEIGISDTKSSDDYLTIYVRDTGIGMSDDIIDKLFRIDETVTSLGTEGEKGTGLGLILCKEFVEKHGGKIWVESEINVGSTFYFSLPIN